MDIVVSAAALLLLAPLLALIALAVVLDSGWPVLFSQVRIGRNFHPFLIWKFRTMRRDPSGPTVTVRGDSRVTRVGRMLRAVKLDELPQLWNVLWGEMSLVGPRPEVPQYVEMYRERYRKILAVRPGITDLASIRFHNEEAVLALAEDPLAEYANRMLPSKLDLAEEYLRSRSLLLDLSILWQTLRAMIRPS